MSKLSRRTLVTSAAALPALTVPAVVAASAEPDPIFAAIERHRSAWVDWSAAVEYEFGLRRADPRHVVAEAATQAKADIRHDRCFNLVEIYPTTIGGVVALLQYYAGTFELDGKTYWRDNFGMPLARHAALALERIAQSAS
jgi:hypothetical protein